MKTLLRALLTTMALVLVALVVIHAINYVRMDLGMLSQATDKAIARSQKILDGAGPGYQARAIEALPSNKNNGSVFHLDTALADATVLEAPVSVDPEADSGIVFSFEFDGTDSAHLAAAKKTSQTSIKDGSIVVVNDPADYLVTTQPLKIAREDIADIQIRARLEHGTEMRIGWPEQDRPDKTWKYNLTVDVVADGEFHNYVVTAANALKQGVRYGALLNQLLIRPSNVRGDRVEIDYIRFVSKLAKYRQAPRGVVYETLGGQMRSALYMLPSQALEFTANVPVNAPKLDVGTGVLFNEAPVDFEITVRGKGGSQQKVLTQHLSDSSRWTDHRIDLTPWAGQEVQIVLRASASNINVAFWSAPTIYSAPKNRMNVILILEDALRADHLSVYGYNKSTSPVKEKLVQHAVVFENAISQATQTRPSVPSLMTSLLPSATGVWHFSDSLKDPYLTLAEVLRSQGFATASFLQNANAGPYAGLHQGFETLIDEEIVGKTTKGVLGKELNAWLDRNKNRNFFVNIHIIDPHGPYDPPAPHDHWFRDLKDKGAPLKSANEFDPSWLKTPTTQSRITLYDGEIENNDALLGNFLRSLDERGLRENTLIVFVADHGEFMGEHGLWGHRPPGYLPVTNVPMIFDYPKRFPGGKRVSETTQIIDVMPTILDAAGVSLEPLLMQGDSLVPVLENGDASLLQQRIVLSEEPTRTKPKGVACNCGSIFYDRWHLINSVVFGNKNLPIPKDLYLHAYDFHRNRLGVGGRQWLSRFDPLLQRRFTATLAAIQSNDIGAWKKWTSGSVEMVHSNPSVRDRLRALGYLQ